MYRNYSGLLRTETASLPTLYSLHLSRWRSLSVPLFTRMAVRVQTTPAMNRDSSAVASEQGLWELSDDRVRAWTRIFGAGNVGYLFRSSVWLPSTRETKVARPQLEVLSLSNFYSKNI